MARPKKEAEGPKCPLCGGDMPVEYSCHMEQFSGRAGWHMSFKPRLTMCHTCSDELLKTIESWYKKRNKTKQFDKWNVEAKE